MTVNELIERLETHKLYIEGFGDFEVCYYDESNDEDIEITNDQIFEHSLKPYITFYGV